MKLYPASTGYIFAVWAVMRNFSHAMASSHSENVASVRKVMQLQQVVEMPFCF